MAPHSSTLAWKIPWMKEPGGLRSMRSLRVDMTERLHFHFSLSGAGEGNGNPLQCSCTENPRGGGAWWAAVYGVTQSWTRLKWLSSSSIHLKWKFVLIFNQSLIAPTLCYSLDFLSFFPLGLAVWPEGSQFPHQGLNLAYSRKSIKS